MRASWWGRRRRLRRRFSNAAACNARLSAAASSAAAASAACGRRARSARARCLEGVLLQLSPARHGLRRDVISPPRPSSARPSASGWKASWKLIFEARFSAFAAAARRSPSCPQPRRPSPSPCRSAPSPRLQRRRQPRTSPHPPSPPLAMNSASSSPPRLIVRRRSTAPRSQPCLVLRLLAHSRRSRLLTTPAAESLRDSLRWLPPDGRRHAASDENTSRLLHQRRKDALLHRLGRANDGGGRLLATCRSSRAPRPRRSHRSDQRVSAAHPSPPRPPPLPLGSSVESTAAPHQRCVGPSRCCARRPRRSAAAPSRRPPVRGRPHHREGEFAERPTGRADVR